MNDYENIKNLEAESQKNLGSLNEDSIIATSDLSNAISAICYNLSNMLDKREGGIVSGDVAVFQHDMKVLSGNYIQVTDPTHVYNYSQKNTFIQAEEAFSGSRKSYGPANTGSYGYCILSVVNGTNYRGLKLSGDISKLTALLDNNAAGAGINYDYSASKSLKVVLNDTSNISNALFSLALSDQGETMRYQISSIDQANNIVYLKQAFSTATAGLTSLSEESCIGLWENDDNAFYVAGFPEIGNAVVKNFYAQHVEGGSSRAVGKYTHAEGRDNIADVRYSHVEGAHNIAAGMATHAEGFQNKVLGKYAHVEGNFAAASGIGSHAEGYKTVASGNYSHAEGGWDTKPGGSAVGDGSHAEGIQTLASGIAAHAEGNLTKASASGAHAEGQKSVASGNYSHAEGSETSAMSNYSHAEGNGSFVSGLWSHAEGYQTSAFGNYSHAEGRQTVAGKAKDGDAAATHSAHADGWGTKALGVASHASGLSVNVPDDYAFAWNGNDNKAVYTSHGPGTFNINPTDGLSGFYIGTQNLCSIISGEITSLNETLQGEIDTKSNVWLSSAATGQPLEGGKLDRLNIVKFDSLETYNLCSNVLTLSDLALIDEANLNAENERILSVADPVEDTDGANKRYVDGKLSSIADNAVLQSFYDAVSISGINSVSLEHTVSAVYELIKALRQ